MSLSEKERPILPPISKLHFPADPALPEGCIPVSLADDPGYEVRYAHQVVYKKTDTCDLHLEILTPHGDRHDALFPLIVYVPGSGWHKQDILSALVPMTAVCRHGFAVAIVEYRPSDDAPFPAQVEDAKAAIRFMKAHAADHHIDPTRVALWGDSSGGHTALLAGMTGDELLPTALYAEQSAAVNCIVDWYGPVDIATMNNDPTTMDHLGPDSPEGYLIGRKPVLEHPALVAPTVPLGYITPERPLPPVLIMHGDRDVLVPFHQSVMLYEALRQNGKAVTFYKLLGADHGKRGFAGEAARAIVVDYLKAQLG